MRGILELVAQMIQISENYLVFQSRAGHWPLRQYSIGISLLVILILDLHCDARFSLGKDTTGLPADGAANAMALSRVLVEGVLVGSGWYIVSLVE